MFGKSILTETWDKISLALTGKIFTEATRAKISEAHTGKTLLEKTKLKISEALTGKIITEITRAKIKKTNLGKNLSEETKEKMSKALGDTIYVYTADKSILSNTFTSARKATLQFNVDKGTIIRYRKNGELFQDKWFLSTTICSPVSSI